MIGRLAISCSASVTIDEVARNAVFEDSAMTLHLTAEPSVASTWSDHSLISSGSSLLFFVFVLGILSRISDDLFRRTIFADVFRKEIYESANAGREVLVPGEYRVDQFYVFRIVFFQHGDE